MVAKTDENTTRDDLMRDPEIMQAWADLVTTLKRQVGRDNPLIAFETAHEMAFSLLLHEIKRAKYQDYLQTRYWQRRRKGALQRARYRCELCPAQANLHVHHKHYERIGEERNEDLIVLCRSCHERFHEMVGAPG